MNEVMVARSSVTGRAHLACKYSSRVRNIHFRLVLDWDAAARAYVASLPSAALSAIGATVEEAVRELAAAVAEADIEDKQALVAALADQVDARE